MLLYFILPPVAFAVSLLSFYAGFGLGTILMPVFAFFFPLPLAIALTSFVHFFNNSAKLLLAGKYADKNIVIRFGIPAIVCAIAGSWLLKEMYGFPEIISYKIISREFSVTWLKIVLSLLIFSFTLFELKKESVFPRMILPLGGILSGFFGGLSGHQGAFRSAFLIRMGLQREVFIGTGVVIAFLVDISRIPVYLSAMKMSEWKDIFILFLITICFAWTGSLIGKKYLSRVHNNAIQKLVMFFLILIATGLFCGLI